MAEEEHYDDTQDMYNGRHEPSAPPMSQSFPQSTSLPVMPSHIPLVPEPPSICIIEQPTSNLMRFRYPCEGRNAGSIPGKHSTAEVKTYPTIEIRNYDGPGTLNIVVSCVTSDYPHLQHPHWLVSKEDAKYCKNGIYSRRLLPNERRFELKKVGIQCVKRPDVRRSLLLRQEMNINPFNFGFDHMNNTGSIKLHDLRLCFQAFIKVGNNTVALDPVVSDKITGKSNDLAISRLCSCSGNLSGGDELIMLCNKVSKTDIKIRFFEIKDGEEIWVDFAEFCQTDVHRQTAIAFKTPRYRSTELQHNVKVFVQLERPSDGAKSEPLEFEYRYKAEDLASRNREAVRQAFESVKRRSDGSQPERFEQSRKLPKQQQQQPQAMSLAEADSQIVSQFIKCLSYIGSDDIPSTSRGSKGTFGQEVKVEQLLYEGDKTYYSYPASPSSCSTLDSYAPVTIMQQPSHMPQLPQLQQQQPLQQAQLQHQQQLQQVAQQPHLTQQQLEFVIKHPNLQDQQQQLPQQRIIQLHQQLLQQQQKEVQQQQQQQLPQQQPSVQQQQLQLPQQQLQQPTVQQQQQQLPQEQLQQPSVQQQLQLPQQQLQQQQVQQLSVQQQLQLPQRQLQQPSVQQQQQQQLQQQQIQQPQQLQHQLQQQQLPLQQTPGHLHSPTLFNGGSITPISDNNTLNGYTTSSFVNITNNFNIDDNFISSFNHVTQEFQNCTLVCHSPLQPQTQPQSEETVPVLTFSAELAAYNPNINLSELDYVMDGQTFNN